MFDKDRKIVVSKMERKPSGIILWLTKFAMMVNEAKTGLCLFNKKDSTYSITEIVDKFKFSTTKIIVL